MELPSSPSTDPLTAKTLLTPEEFRALAAHIHRAESRLNNAIGIAVGGLSITVMAALGSIWFGYPAAIVSWMVLQRLKSMYLRTYSGTQKHKQHTERLMRFLAETQDANMVRPILDLEVSYDVEEENSKLILPSIHAAMLRLLPLIEARHSDSLTSRHRDLIWGYMFRKKRPGECNLTNMPYARGVLHAMEQVGGRNELPNLKSMHGSYGVSQELKAAIQHCIDIVEERVAREEGKEFLLRAGDNPDVSETLLRPTIERADTPSDQLLRASAGETKPPHEIP